MDFYKQRDRGLNSAGEDDGPVESKSVKQLEDEVDGKKMSKF
jgi:hypothetical protein